jgi:hypothetical protein
MQAHTPKFLLASAMIAILAAAGCSQSSTPSTSTPSAENSQPAAPAAPATPAPPPAPKFESVVVPTGTTIEVTIDQALGSNTNAQGDRFAASLAAPVVVNNKVVMAKGAKVAGSVTEAKSAGRFKGNAELSLVLSSVTVGGKAYKVETSAFSQKTTARGKRTAITTGIGAAAGAAIGALAGGGKGAAVGAGAGAGAGVAGGALTGERDVELAPETKVDFQLAAPVTIRVPLS